MGGLSPMHLGLVLVIALLVFGPKKLPEIGRELGQAIREFKKASREVMESFHDAAEDRPHSSPAYDSYQPAVYEEASYPHDPAGTPSAPAASVPVGEGSSMPSGPPAGTVDRSAHAPAHPAQTAAASLPADLTPAARAATHEPAREPALPERNT
jgi:sec-independent protein translocase protein TatA